MTENNNAYATIKVLPARISGGYDLCTIKENKKEVNGYGLWSKGDKTVDGKELGIRNLEHEAFVQFGGVVYIGKSEAQEDPFILKDSLSVKAVPYDVENNEWITRLWEAEFPEQKSEASSSQIEMLMRKQYFLASASLQDILSEYSDFWHLPILQADASCAILVPELMRLLMDERKLEWDEAWNIAKISFDFKDEMGPVECSVEFFMKEFPRLYMILDEMNRRHQIAATETYGGSYDNFKKYAIIWEGKVRMKNLANSLKDL